MKKYLLILPLFIICFSSCSRLHEAQHVVAEADNFHSAGKIYDDSIALADAVATLHNYRLLHPNDYAKANYYYGKLLRSKENYVAAMQCFIDASHSHSTNHNILGRVYSNMGSMCHLADEFQLSYEMFEQCANQFKKANNNSAYYYALNDMAFELAEQKKIDETIQLLNQIKTESADSAPVVKSLETMALLYFKIEQYDSTIYYTNLLLQKFNFNEPNIISLKARALSMLEQNDSALYYANIIMSLEGCVNDKFNVLYILMYNDSTITTTEALQRSSEREDLRHDKYEPRKEQFIKAAHLLRQEIGKKSDYTIFIYVYVIIIAVAICIKMPFLIKTKIARQQYIELCEENKTQFEINEKLKKEQEKLYESTYIINQKQITHQKQITVEIENNVDTLLKNADIMRVLHWDNFSHMCEKINTLFFSLILKLKKYNLSEQEIRLCILVLLKYGYGDMSKQLNYSSNGIGKLKYRVAKKIGTTSSSMRNFLIKIIIEG